MTTTRLFTPQIKDESTMNEDQSLDEEPSLNFSNANRVAIHKSRKIIPLSKITLTS